MHEGKNAVGASALETVLLLAHQERGRPSVKGLVRRILSGVWLSGAECAQGTMGTSQM